LKQTRRLKTMFARIVALPVLRCGDYRPIKAGYVTRVICTSGNINGIRVMLGRRTGGGIGRRSQLDQWNESKVGRVSLTL